MAAAALVGFGEVHASAAETQWMDGTSQWSVGFVDSGPESYCTLFWNSETGRTVEFRQGLKNASWRLSDSSWNLAQNAPAKVVLTGQSRMMAIDAVADDKTTLDIGDHASVVRAIIQNSISGTVDLNLAVGDQGEEWEIPISRILSMHAGVSRCLRRLSMQAAIQKQQPASEQQSGF